MAMADASGHFVADMLNADRLTSNRLVSDEYGTVDIKSSQFNKKYAWYFLIRKDQFPDHFAFACFDDDFIFTRCYFVPANVVQDRRTVTITSGGESKWLPYLTYAIDIQTLKSPKQSKVIGRSTPYIVRRRKKRKLLCSIDPIFFRILRGGIRNGHLILRSQVLIKNNKFFYCGQRFDRAQWDWQPPKFFRLQGRHARVYHIISNDFPIEWFYLGDTWVKVRRRCDTCDGALIYEPDGSLYCNECGLQAR